MSRMPGAQALVAMRSSRPVHQCRTARIRLRRHAARRSRAAARARYRASSSGSRTSPSNRLSRFRWTADRRPFASPAVGRSRIDVYFDRFGALGTGNEHHGEIGRGARRTLLRGIGARRGTRICRQAVFPGHACHRRSVRRGRVVAAHDFLSEVTGQSRRTGVARDRFFGRCLEADHRESGHRLRRDVQDHPAGQR